MVKHRYFPSRRQLYATIRHVTAGDSSEQQHSYPANEPSAPAVDSSRCLVDASCGRVRELLANARGRSPERQVGKCDQSERAWAALRCRTDSEL
jgi:hypothetical protein